MADSMYSKGKQNILSGNIAFLTDNLKVVLIDETDHNAGSGPALSTDADLTDIETAAREETSPNLGTKSVTDGTFDAADVTFSATTGDACDSFTCYKDSGVASTSYLIFNMDAAAGLPVSLGGDVTIAWNGSGIFAWTG